MSFSTHSLRPETVLGLAQQLFGADTEGYILGIRGYAFNEFEESLSEGARANLAAAAAFVEQLCRQGRFAQAADDGCQENNRASSAVPVATMADK
jgi:hypothetical protein